jgi:hypothetical protein
MTTVAEDKAFIESVIDRTLLEASMEWIGNNLSPGDVFSERMLESWAKENGYIKDDL